MAKTYGAGKENLARRRVKRVALVGGLANAIAFAWQNPEDKAILVTKVLVDETTAGGTATAVLDIGVVADAVSTADTLIDGMDANAVGLYDNITDKGTNGKSRQKMDAMDGTNDYITGKILVANASALAGYAYIEYILVED